MSIDSDSDGIPIGLPQTATNTVLSEGMNVQISETLPDSLLNLLFQYPRIQAFIKENDLKDNHGLQAYFNRRVRAMLTKKGKSIVGWDEELYKRYPYDPEASKKLLAEAGYPDGFSVTFDCPNDRYVNDEAICQSIVPMLARIGIDATLNAQTKGLHFDKIGLKQGNNTSLFLLGWTPGTYDGLNPLVNLMTTKGEGHGTWNCGKYTNPRIEELTKKIAVEVDAEKRAKMLFEAHKIHREDFGHIPLHQQALAWGVQDFVDIKQPANDSVWLRYVKITK